MSSSELTPVERAAAEALSKAATLQGFRLYNLREVFARAVVAAVEPIIVAKTLQDTEERLKAARELALTSYLTVKEAVEVINAVFETSARAAERRDGGENHG